MCIRDSRVAALLFDIGGVQVEVSELLGVQVDVVTPAALPESWRSRIIACLLYTSRCV